MRNRSLVSSSSIAAWAISICALAGCASAPVPALDVPAVAPGAEAAAASPSPAPAPPGARGAAEGAAFASLDAPPSATTPSSAPTAAKQSAQPKDEDGGSAAGALLIYVGDVGLVVPAKELDATFEAIIDIAESFGGHLARRDAALVEVRIPSGKFRDAMVQIAGLGEVTRQAVTAEDVTQEYRDLEVRLQNLRATRNRLDEFLARAANMQEMLAVEHELERVAAQIDQIEGRLRFLHNRTSLSQLVVTLSKKVETPPVVVKETRPAPRGPALPIEWLGTVGIDNLLHFD